jgi:hypothetical protein
MAVVLHRYGRNNVKVSTQWLAALRGADQHRVPFTVNSGARTEAEQKHQIAEKGCWTPSNNTGAACPWWTSNHVIKTLRFLIRMGRPDKFKGAAHALDVQPGGEDKLQRWLNSHRGVRATNPVQGEPWHLEINRSGLWRLYRKYRRLVR